VAIVRGQIRAIMEKPFDRAEFSSFSFDGKRIDRLMALINIEIPTVSAISAVGFQCNR
jgi:hypothetical protein